MTKNTRGKSVLKQIGKPDSLQICKILHEKT